MGKVVKLEPTASGQAAAKRRARALAARGAVRALRELTLGRQLVGEWGAVSLMDVLLGLAEGLPSGAYTGAGIEKYLRKVLAEPDRSDDFRELACELYITATDLDTCERVV